VARVDANQRRDGLALAEARLDSNHKYLRASLCFALCDS
jgi:hypothetical protein